MTLLEFDGRFVCLASAMKPDDIGLVDTADTQLVTAICNHSYSDLW